MPLVPPSRRGVGLSGDGVYRATARLGDRGRDGVRDSEADEDLDVVLDVDLHLDVHFEISHHRLGITDSASSSRRQLTVAA